MNPDKPMTAPRNPPDNAPGEVFVVVHRAGWIMSAHHTRESAEREHIARMHERVVRYVKAPDGAE